MDQGEFALEEEMISTLRQSLELRASIRRKTVPEVVDTIKRSIMDQGPDPEIISDFVAEMDAVVELYK